MDSQGSCDADVPIPFRTMDADVAFALLSSCRTVDIRTKYLLWVHGSISLALKPGV